MRAAWTPSGSPFISVQNREQTEIRLLVGTSSGLRYSLVVEVKSSFYSQAGDTKLVHSEVDHTWVNIDQSVPQCLKDGNFLWLSHLYLFVC